MTVPVAVTSKTCPCSDCALGQGAPLHVFCLTGNGAFGLSGKIRSDGGSAPPPAAVFIRACTSVKNSQQLHEHWAALPRRLRPKGVEPPPARLTVAFQAIEYSVHYVVPQPVVIYVVPRLCTGAERLSRVGPRLGLVFVGRVGLLARALHDGVRARAAPVTRSHRIINYDPKVLL